VVPAREPARIGQTLFAARLAAIFVIFHDAVRRHAQSSGQRAGKLTLAGAGRAIQEQVNALAISSPVGRACTAARPLMHCEEELSGLDLVHAL